MTDKTTPDAELSPEAAQLLAEQTAAQIEASPSTAADQAATAAAITERGPGLPAEADIDKFMEDMKAQFAGMSAELNALKAQQAAALVADGGPLAVRYAQGAADKIGALVTAHPDAPRDHFAPAVKAAAELADAATAAAKGNGSAGALQAAEQALSRFFDRTHWRNWGKHIDFSAIVDDVGTAVDEGLKLASA